MSQEAIQEIDMDVFARRISPYFTWLESKIESGWEQHDSITKDVLKECKFLSTNMRAKFILGVSRADFVGEVQKAIDLFDLAQDAFRPEADEIQAKIQQLIKGISEELGPTYVPSGSMVKTETPVQAPEIKVTPVEKPVRPVMAPAPTIKVEKPVVRQDKPVLAVEKPLVKTPVKPAIAKPAVKQMKPAVKAKPIIKKTIVKAKPKIAVKKPTVKTPVKETESKFKLPTLSLPKFSMPKMPKMHMPKVSMPSVKMPKVNMPSMPKGKNVKKAAKNFFVVKWVRNFIFGED